MAGGPPGRLPDSTNRYTANTWSASTGWSDGEPSLRVGEGFLLDDQGNNPWQDGTGYFPRPAGTNYYFVGSAGVFTNTLRAGKLWFGFNDDAVPGTTINDNTGIVHGTLQITHPRATRPVPARDRARV